MRQGGYGIVPQSGVLVPVSPHRLIRSAAEMSGSVITTGGQSGAGQRLLEGMGEQGESSISCEPSGVRMGWVGPPTVERGGWWVLGWQSRVTWWSEWTSCGCLGDPPTLCSLSELLRASLRAPGAHWYPR